MINYILEIKTTDGLSYSIGKTIFDNISCNYIAKDINRNKLIEIMNDILDCFKNTLISDNEITNDFIESFKQDIPSIKDFLVSDIIEDTFKYNISLGAETITIGINIENQK